MFTFKYTRTLLTLSLLLTSAPAATTPSRAPAIAKTWVASYGTEGDEIGRSLVATADGGYAVAGSTTHGGSTNVWVLKLDAAGNVQWQKRYGETGYDSAYSLVATADGGYAVAGETDSFGAGPAAGRCCTASVREAPTGGDFDVWVLKLDADGNVQWQKTYGGSQGDRANSLVATADGGYALAGQTHSFGGGNFDVWVLKLDRDRNVQWQKTYGGANFEAAYSLIATGDGGYLVGGEVWSFGAGGSDAWVLKLDAAGNVQWQKTYGGGANESAHSLVATADGGYAVAGILFSAGRYNAWVLKLEPSGNVQWEKIYAVRSANDGFAYSLVATGDGGYAVAGHNLPAGKLDYDIWVLKLDAAGNVQWSKTYGGNTTDYGYSLLATADGGYAVAGAVDSFGAGGYDVCVLKLDSEGNAGQTCPVISTLAPAVGSSGIVGVPSSATVLDSTAVVAASSLRLGDTTASSLRQCLDGGTMHIANIDPRYQPAGQGYRIGAEVAVVDALDAPVVGAEVSLTISLPNGRQVQVTGLTGSEGHFSPVGRTQLPGTYTFLVTNVSKTGYAYDPSQNVETSDSITIP